MKKGILCTGLALGALLATPVLTACGNKPPQVEQPAQIKAEITTEDFKFKQITGKNEYELVGRAVAGQTGDIIVPDTVDGFPVTKIGDFAFSTSYLKTSDNPSDWPTGSVEYHDNTLDPEHPERIKLILGDSSITSIALGNNIEEIGKCAFANCAITSLSIPNNVKIIGDHSFFAITTLSSLTFEENSTLELIDKSGFGGCSNLESMVLPASLVEIRDSAFNKCSKLCSVTFEQDSQLEIIGPQVFKYSGLTNFVTPSSVETIGAGAFATCKDLTSISLPEGLKRIENHTFRDSGLTSISIPASVEYIGKVAFRSHYGMETEDGTYIDWESQLETVTFANNSQLATIDSNAFDGCVELSSINLENCTKLTSINSYGFYDNISLTSVTLPASIENIENFAFSCKTKGTSTLSTVTFNTTKDGDQTSNTYNKFTSNLQKIGYAAFLNCSALNYINLASCLKLNEIQCQSFRSTTALTEIFIPTSVKTIGIDSYTDESQTLHLTTFYETGISRVIVEGVEGLANFFNINFGNNYSNPLTANEEVVLQIQDSTQAIETLDLTSTSLTRISDVINLCSSLLHNATEVSSIILPSTVKTIEDNAFYNCAWLKSITLNEGLEAINYRAFRGSALESITIPSSVTTLGNQSFMACASLETLTFNQSATIRTSVGNQAFYQCTNLETATLNNQISDLGNESFYGCNKLLNVNFSENSNALNRIGSKSFYGCSVLTSIIIPHSVQIIETQAFSNCISLSTVSFAKDTNSDNALTTIEYHAFASCKSLTEFIITKNVTMIGYGIFQSVNSSPTIPAVTFEDETNTTWTLTQNTDESSQKTITVNKTSGLEGDNLETAKGNNGSLLRSNGTYNWIKNISTSK